MIAPVTTTALPALLLADSFCFPLHRLLHATVDQNLGDYTMSWIPQLAAEMQKFSSLALVYSAGPV